MRSAPSRPVLSTPAVRTNQFCHALCRARKAADGASLASCSSQILAWKESETNKPKHRIIGTATYQIRSRHSRLGLPAKASMIGKTTRTPSVSPPHQVIQLSAMSLDRSTPASHMPPFEIVALIITKKAAGHVAYRAVLDSRSRGATVRRQCQLAVPKRM